MATANWITATRTGLYNANATVVGTSGVTYRYRHKAPYAMSGMRLMYGNFYATAGDQDGANAITVKAGVRLTATGTTVPVTFNGARSVTIAPGGIVESDPVGFSAAAGSFFYSMTCVLGPAGGSVAPTGLDTLNTFSEGNAAGDVVDSGSITGANAAGYHPMCIAGVGAARVPVVGLVGDSIFEGFDAQNSTTWPLYYAGIGLRGANETLPIIHLAKGGESAQNLSGLGRRYRWAALKYASHVIVEHGVNDVTASRTFAQISADLQELYTDLATTGKIVIGTTLTPHTSQTGAHRAVTREVVEWQRARATNVSYVWDVRRYAETSPFSWTWVPTYSTDNLHPNQVGAAALALTFPTTYILGSI